MDHAPTPPAGEKTPLHIGDMPAQICERSEYWGRSAREVVDIYTGKLKKVRLQTVALLLGDVVLAVWSLNASHGVLYLICLAGIIAIATWCKMRCEVCFQGLDTIVSSDCNPAGYRDVLEALAERDKRSRMTTASVHQPRANWQLYLAEYEMLHGSRDEAWRLASDTSLDPLTPRMQHLRDDIRSRLKAR